MALVLTPLRGGALYALLLALEPLEHGAHCERAPDRPPRRP
jgi:hypothetical protein